MDDNGFVGILLCWEISNYSYIEHFAIHPSMRERTLGSRSLETFCGNRSFVILEIDPPVDEISIRRECFYVKLGFKKNNYQHFHPPYQKQFLPHELTVMSYPECMNDQKYLLFRRELVETVMKDTAV